MLVTDGLLLDYKRCQRRAYLNVYGSPEDRSPERDFLLKLRQESYKHTQSVLQTAYPHYQEPSATKGRWDLRTQATIQLMAEGADCIYSGCLTHGLGHLKADHDTLLLLGYPPLLVKRPGQSHWGDWEYIPVSIQLGRRPKPEYKILAAFYAQLIAVHQGHLPPHADIILRRGNLHRVDLQEWLPRFQQTLTDCVQTLVHRGEPEVFISRQRCTLCHWHSHCYALAQAQEHLSLVPGVTPSRYESLQSLGVFTISALAQFSTSSMEELMGPAIATQLQLQAQAMVENRAILKTSPTAPPLPQASVELYFDIEAEPERNLDYLLGVMVVDHRTGQEQFHGFLAETPEQEQQIWQAFLALVNRYPTAPIFHFSEYEVETIKRLAQLYDTPKRERNRLLTQCFDLHRYVVATVTCPVESYSLKALANWLGFQWRDAGASGDQSVCWYDQWLESGERQYLHWILRYNEDDCRATWVLKDWLGQFLALHGELGSAGKTR